MCFQCKQLHTNVCSIWLFPTLDFMHVLLSYHIISTRKFTLGGYTYNIPIVFIDMGNNLWSYCLVCLSTNCFTPLEFSRATIYLLYYNCHPVRDSQTPIFFFHLLFLKYLLMFSWQLSFLQAMFQLSK